jgi:hypothetical protein
MGQPTNPYLPGMNLTVVFITGKGESRELRIKLPGPDRLGPVFGPDWTPFGPASD